MLQAGVNMNQVWSEVIIPTSAQAEATQIYLRRSYTCTVSPNPHNLTPQYTDVNNTPTHHYSSSMRTYRITSSVSRYMYTRLDILPCVSLMYLVTQHLGGKFTSTNQNITFLSRDTNGPMRSEYFVLGDTSPTAKRVVLTG